MIYKNTYLTFEAITSGTFSFSTNNIQYSTNNGSSWTTLTAGSSTPTVAAGNKIMWKQTGLTPTSSSGIGTFSSTGNFNISGNVMSLHYGDDFASQTSLSGKNYAFKSLFKNCTGLVSAESLTIPALTLSNNCYYEMFISCTSLTTAPKILPAITLTYECYRVMFQDCSSLTTAPLLPATTLAENCYRNMFTACVSLSNLPTLPAQTLATGCYKGMFSYCYAITKVPSNYLPALTLADSCYYEMFKMCTALKKSPILRAPTMDIECYYRMFYYCTSLEYIACLATNPDEYNTDGWAREVSTVGKFIQNSSSWSSGESGIPYDWDSISYDDDLVYDMALSIGTDNIDYNASTTISNDVETVYYGYIDDVTDSTTFITNPTGIITIT